MEQNKIAEIKVSYSNIIPVESRKKIRTSKQAYDLLIQIWDADLLELQEEFKVIMLNNANDIIGIYSMSKGGTAGTVVDVKLIFAVALKCNATAIMLAHNHPSGNLKPSIQDIELTNKIKKGSEILGMKILDHLILAKTCYYSFADEGVI
ncbi:JAB domain-containing protein [bacterium]|nr:JAB domain-containing protein [bacterium]